MQTPFEPYDIILYKTLKTFFQYFSNAQKKSAIDQSLFIRQKPIFVLTKKVETKKKILKVFINYSYRVFLICLTNAKTFILFLFFTFFLLIL